MDEVTKNTAGEGVPLLNKESQVVEENGQLLFKAERMYESLRVTEFEITSGLGEILDNSMEAGSKDVWVEIEKEKRKDANSKKEVEVISQIAVIDNGNGMSPDVLNRCLVLGDTIRPPKPGGAKGIGKFGVGLTLGGISLSRRVEVYSRDNKHNEFAFTYLDLDLIAKKQQQRIPTPVSKKPPERFAKLLEDETGTIVLLVNCDRLQFDLIKNKPINASDEISSLAHFFGRTYRKFIYGGRKIHVNGAEVFLHDPLYKMGPTRFERDSQEPKATLWGKSESIELEIPNSGGKKAALTITMTLLPKEWRKKRGDGAKQFALDRKIQENEGISILRANREVLYAPVPYLIGKRGQARFLDIDRWWGCEVSFPPELDDYFTVKYIKRGAQPIESLRDKIREIISAAVNDLREKIQKDFREEKQRIAKQSGIFDDAEKAMSDAETFLPKGKQGTELSKDREEEIIDGIVDKAVDDEKKTREDKKRELADKPYSIVPVNLPEMFFFDTVHMLGKIVIELNVNHPFYKNVFEPLCGSIENLDEDGDNPEDTEEKRKVRQAIMLMLLSYAKSESFFTDPQQVGMLAQLKMQWGMTLGAVINNVAEKDW